MKYLKVGVLSLFGLGLGTYSSAQEWKEPLPSFTPNTWQWIEVPESSCRDGSNAGFFVNYSNESDNVMIFLEGGGACFNSQTCSLSPSRVSRTPPGAQGVFDRSDSSNPVANWNIVFVPYCTGDVYAGSNDNGYVSSRIQNQKFVGFRNMTRFLERIAPTFSKADQVLLTGESAGGFGAVWNYDQTQEIFGDVPVHMIDDSGIVFSDDYLAPCLQNRWRQLWGLNDTLPKDCSDCQSSNGGGLAQLPVFLEDKYPDRDFGYVSSLSDSVIRLFFGYGRNNCRVIFPSTPASTFRAGMFEMRDDILSNQSVFYLTEGTDHTSLSGGSFYSKRAGGQSLNHWVADFLNRDAVSKGP
ncbi:pectin acetylesterase-family hydrolase [Pseudobacteriovorax antillogorgiicola]|uniref:Pectinacetylesterase n=1 Tax=Pseudobacteriovorax antillogorgiicola TaxID=1513793 RepID=A0A1Y6CKP5_9BACT|nr:pectin acetylesterase-family hydrolase [Pseudobacteriovorax antillogorgiicola]TCS45849.1 pectinacetylesterase [Pseudobacteriovorax antillogorgiicola]SMF71760.1 Pectinacetylesterase [Pseudobacteriovorax antillogorgiicola]